MTSFMEETEMTQLLVQRGLILFMEEMVAILSTLELIIGLLIVRPEPNL